MVVDSDYRGEVMVALHNDSNEERVVSPNDRIGQFVLMPQFEIIFNEVNTLEDTERGAAGFGSTGK
jgi:dUTP pyrophosphatase